MINYATSCRLLKYIRSAATVPRPMTYYYRKRHNFTNTYRDLSIISLSWFNQLAAKEGLFNDSVLSTNFIVATVSNLIYTAGYIRDLSGLLKLSRNWKKDEVAYIKCSNRMLRTILLLHPFLRASQSLSNSLVNIRYIVKGARPYGRPLQP